MNDTNANQPDPCLHARRNAEYHRIEPQREGEHDFDFRLRVSGELRAKGKIIEAHESFQNARWDDPQHGKSVLDGITGGCALALSAPAWPQDPERQIGDDICAGVLVDHWPEKKARDEAYAAMFNSGMMGPLLDSMSPDRSSDRHDGNGGHDR